MASRNPALPLDSHVQSHAEVFKNELCEFPRSPHRESDRRWLDSKQLPGSGFSDDPALVGIGFGSGECDHQHGAHGDSSGDAGHGGDGGSSGH